MACTVRPRPFQSTSDTYRSSSSPPFLTPHPLLCHRSCFLPFVPPRLHPFARLPLDLPRSSPAMPRREWPSKARWWPSSFAVVALDSFRPAEGSGGCPAAMQNRGSLAESFFPSCIPGGRVAGAGSIIAKARNPRVALRRGVASRIDTRAAYSRFSFCQPRSTLPLLHER